MVANIVMVHTTCSCSAVLCLGPAACTRDLSRCWVSDDQVARDRAWRRPEKSPSRRVCGGSRSRTLTGRSAQSAFADVLLELADFELEERPEPRLVGSASLSMSPNVRLELEDFPKLDEVFEVDGGAKDDEPEMGGGSGDGWSVPALDFFRATLGDKTSSTKNKRKAVPPSSPRVGFTVGQRRVSCVICRSRCDAQIAINATSSSNFSCLASLFFLSKS